MKMPLYVAAAAAACALAVGATTAYAQYGQRGNPLEDFLNKIGRDDHNQSLGCNVVKRIGRDGDITYLQMTCRTYGHRP